MRISACVSGFAFDEISHYFIPKLRHFSSSHFSKLSSDTKLTMGRKRRRNRMQNNKEGSDGGGSGGKWRGANSGKAGLGYSNVVMDNPAFENYYKEQNLVPEGEWDQFMASLKTHLPATFRITGFRGQANQVLRYLKGECFNELLKSDAEEAIETKPTAIPWYPDELAWQLNLSRKNIRKMPTLEKLHLFLISETESGNISRQEIVSMIPPILLQVKPHHKVLDMCAAPGSKTAQLIEMLHAEETMGWPEGFVIGNDSDNKRCYIMVHQAKRLNSPCCMVVNHDASVFPRLQVPGPDGGMTNVEYDRILCDVPCGGDGTMRKNYAIWKRWTPLSGFNLHPLQRRILLRGIELLAVGGRLVYSTCSFNPVENEAVIAGVLKQCEGAVELVDVSDELPGLKRIPGKTTWKVIDDKGQIFTSFEEVQEREDREKRRRYKPSFFPPSEDEAKDMNLTRCVRILPHHQDTGGFFVAVLQKTRPLPWMKQDKTNDKETSQDDISFDQPSEALETSEDVSSAVGETNESDVSSAAGETNESDVSSAAGETNESDVSSAARETNESDVSSAARETNESDVSSAVTDEPTVSSTNDTSQESTETDKSDKPTDANGSQMGPPSKKARFTIFREDPFVFFKEGEDVWPPIKQFYDMEDSFPITQLLTRCYVGKKRNIYLTNKLIKGILEHNDKRIKVINSGVRVLARSDAHDVACDFRLSQEGINVIYPYIRDRKITITREDVITLFSEEAPFTKNFSEGIRDTLENTPMGAVILTYHPKTKSGEEPDSSIILVAWRGKTSLRSYVAKNDRQHILRMVGGPVEAYKKPSPPVRTNAEADNTSERTEGIPEDGGGDGGDAVMEEDGGNEEQGEDATIDDDDDKKEEEEKNGTE
nr:RNA cytosine-C(5)-methyltransferase NSUN2-like [Lytechinus pictus]